MSSIPGKFAVERYPILKYVPSLIAPWKAQMLQQRQKDIDLYVDLLNEVREKVARNASPTCFAKHLLQEQERLGMTDLEIAYTAGSPFGAGVETVSDLSEVFRSESMLTLYDIVGWLPGKLLSRLCQIRTSLYS
jgi:cytochrome P450